MGKEDLVKRENRNNYFLYALTGGCFVVIAVAFYYFYFKKDFLFFIETSCDQNKEQCFQRDCSNPDDCPFDSSNTFKRYSLKASDFKYCADEDCTEACETGKIKCTQVKCIAGSEAGWEELCMK